MTAGLLLIVPAFYAGGFIAVLQILLAAGEYQSGGRISMLDTFKIAALWPIYRWDHE